MITMRVRNRESVVTRPAMSRASVAAALREIAARIKLLGSDRFRARAYAGGATVVESLSEAELWRRVGAGTLTEIPGIGAALARVIADLTQTGRSDVLERLRATAPAAVLELNQVPGLTRARARKLHDALGINSVEELASAARAGRLREVKGFGPKTEAAVIAAVDAYLRQPAAIRLVDARAEAATLGRQLLTTGSSVTAVEVAGSVRRWEEEINEVALVAIVEGDPAAVFTAIRAHPAVARIEHETADRVLARQANGVRLTVRVSSPARRGLTMIEETGPPRHLADLRQRAGELGTTWDALALPDEQAVYAALGLPLIPPEARAWCPIPPPADLSALVSADDIRGLVHCHTDYSDGRHSLEQMARAADARGFEYMTVTDHSQSASYAGGLTVDRLRRQWDEMARVQEQVEVRLLRGTESDILADGALDYPDHVLEQMDVVIASIHVRHRMNAGAMTERLLRAMRLPVFKIWGHPLGRLVLRRPAIDCDVERVLDAAADARVAIELDGDPYRLDLPPALIPAARARGIPFVISTDAHAVNDLENLEYGVAMARRGGVTRGEVLNCLPYEVFRARVRPR